MSDTTTEIDLSGYVTAEDANIFWLLFGAVLVFFMQTGFAMLEVGSVRVKNTKNILTKNIFDASFGAICWWLIGYPVAMGKDHGGFIGGSGFALKGSDFEGDDGSMTNGSAYAMWLFQWAFAATAATIVSGAVAERVTFTAYLIYSICLTTFLYPVVVHWGWHADGWASAWRESDLLFGCGVIDFAGSGVVHMTGGIAALIGATLLGARHGRFDKGAEADFEGQSSIFQTLGTLILWFGWYGFNGVSTLAISGLAGVAAKTMVTTTISAAAACVSTVAIGKIRYGYVDAGLANNGILAGLVAITAGCSVVEPEGAFIIGIFAGPTYFFSSRALKALHIDDVVDAAPVHLFCGAWGVLAAGLFATEGNYAAAYYGDRASECHGLFYGGGLSQFGANVVFVLSVIAWVTAGSLAMFLPMKLCGCLRVSAAVELLGIDAHKHTAMNPGDMDSEAFETAVEMAVEMALEKSPRLSNSLRQRPSVTETEMTSVNGAASAV